MSLPTSFFKGKYFSSGGSGEDTQFFSVIYLLYFSDTLQKETIEEGLCHEIASDYIVNEIESRSNKKLFFSFLINNFFSEDIQERGKKILNVFQTFSSFFELPQLDFLIINDKQIEVQFHERINKSKVLCILKLIRLSYIYSGETLGQAILSMRHYNFSFKLEHPPNNSYFFNNGETSDLKYCPFGWCFSIKDSTNKFFSYLPTIKQETEDEIRKNSSIWHSSPRSLQLFSVPPEPLIHAGNRGF